MTSHGAPGADDIIAVQDNLPPAQGTEQDNHLLDDVSFSDVDSGIGSSEEGSLTTSITSSILNYEYENGRRYQRWRDDDKYIFPNDEEEQDRLDMLHHVYLLVQDGRIVTAPISQPQRVLDIGAGTGFWALDFAEQFPAADVLGVDMDPIQPNWVAPNCRFMVDDVEAPWDYDAAHHFDYIHQRSMAGSIGSWPGLYTQALDNLVDGGWLEIQEFDVWFYSQREDKDWEQSSIMQWQKLIDQASTGIGRRLNCAAELKGHLERAGFADVREEVVKVPIGTWPKDRKLRGIGIYLQLQMNQAIEAVTLGYFSRILQWSDEETNILMAKVRNEFNDKSLQLYTYCRYITGRKVGH